MDEKKLVRPRNGAWIAGVCAGFARYFGLDPTIIRVAGTGILAYAICWIVIPSEP